MAAILFLADGPKSIASVFPVIYHISNLKSIAETVLKILRSQVGQTARQTDGQKDRRKEGQTDGRPAFLCPTQTSFAEDYNMNTKMILEYHVNR